MTDDSTAMKCYTVQPLRCLRNIEREITLSQPVDFVAQSQSGALGVRCRQVFKAEILPVGGRSVHSEHHPGTTLTIGAEPRYLTTSSRVHRKSNS